MIEPKQAVVSVVDQVQIHNVVEPLGKPRLVDSEHRDVDEQQRDEEAHKPSEQSWVKANAHFQSVKAPTHPSVFEVVSSRRQTDQHEIQDYVKYEHA